MNRRLSNIQWRQMRFAIWVSAVVACLTILIAWLYHGIDFETLYSTEWLHIPLFLWVIALILFVGSAAGYVHGNLIKKRLERLVDSILRYERGNFAHRVPYLGEDEIGLVADHLNQMAHRVEQQVASLQKLSSQKAEWNNQLKKAAVTEERQRLARELHDAVSQQLFAISMMASALLETLPPNEDSTRKQMAMVEKMAGHAQNEMRALLLHLRPATLEGKGLKEGLEELLTDFEAKQAMTIEWKINELPTLAKGIEDHLFRIVQEGLSNVFRHSEATKASVKLYLVNRQLHLKIIDNGIGFNMQQTKASSYGLQSIHERANEIGGVAEIVSLPDKGTEIDVKVPIVNE